MENVLSVQEPYKLANRKFHPEDSIVDVCGVKIGGKKLTIIAGPCSVETTAQITEVAKDVKESGASILRGGAIQAPYLPVRLPGPGEDGP